MSYKQYLVRAFGIVLATAAFSNVSAYEITTPSEQLYLESSFKSQNGAPTIHFYTKKSCKENCDRYLEIGNKVMRFNPDASVIARARYKGKSYAVVKQGYIKNDGKKSFSRDEYHFASEQGAQRRIAKTLCGNSLDTGITVRGELICVTNKSIEVHDVNNSQQIELPVSADIATINNNLAGTLGISIIDTQSKQLAYSNYYNLNANGDKAWQTMPTVIHSRSDRRNVMALYPVNRAKSVVAVYEYVSALNKGLNLYQFDEEGGSYRVVTNNEDNSWGFEPEVFYIGGQYVITAKQGFNNDKATYYIDSSLLSEPETYSNENNNASMFEFMGGYGVQANKWEAWQSVNEDIETKYSIDDSLLHTVYLQGRIKDTQVSLKYLTSLADESNTQGASESVDILTGLVDFDGFFKGADTLRFKMDIMKTSGTANFKSSNQNFCLQSGCNVTSEFDSKYVNIETLVFSEGGNFMGLSYTNYAMPSALGLQTSSERLHGIAFDEDYEHKKYMFVIGRDAAAYASRYELDYKGIYLLPTLGIGAVQHGFSDSAIQEALNGDGRDVIGEFALALTGTIDFGYIYQRRWLESKGLGYSVQGGLRAKYDWTSSKAAFTPSSHDDLEIAYSGSNLMWGPYLQFNVIF